MGFKVGSVEIIDASGNITATVGDIDGRDIAADGSKLDGIETAATADQTPAEILTAIKTVDGAASGLDADLLDGQEGSYYLDGNNFINLPAGYADADVDTHLNTSTASSGEVLQWDGSDYDWAPVDAFPSGTKMLFQQTSAPTGWTKDTTHDNKALRVVSGTAGSGGTSSFTTIFANRTSSSTAAGGTVGNRTLTVSQMPSHNHTLLGRNHAGASGNINEFGDTQSPQTRSNTSSILNKGSSGSHNHSFSGSSHSHTLDMSVQYVDLIIATKN